MGTSRATRQRRNREPAASGARRAATPPVPARAERPQVVRVVRVALMIGVVVLVAWIRALPLSLDGIAPSLRPMLRYTGEDGHEHVYLGDYDSYVWLRNARNYLRTGTTCDAVVNGECRDLYGNAPVGSQMRYGRSLHIVAIVAVHRVLSLFRPGYPLAASAFWVPVIVGAFGALSAMAIGWQLAGPLGGVCAAVVSALNPVFLVRSFGSDNDVWNVVLPLCMMWAAMTALSAAHRFQQAAYAIVAALFATLHAATWRGWTFTYDVLLVGLLAHLAIQIARQVWHARRLSAVGSDPGVRRAGLVLLLFYGFTGIYVTLTGSAEDYLRLPLTVVETAFGGMAGTTQGAAEHVSLWPDVFTTVAELRPANLANTAAQMGGVMFFFIGWLGLMVLVLPHRRWQWWHFAILIGGNYLYRYLLTAGDLGHAGRIGLLVLPITMAMLFVVADDREVDADQGTGVIVVIWFLAALLLAYGGERFVMLLVPPFALTFAAGVGRLEQWLAERIRGLAVQQRLLARCMLCAILLAVLIEPVRKGYTTARTYMPAMSDTWWDVLTTLRNESPPDTIINAWWDYGYWIKYVAERRVIADGGSLSTHVSHWFARALVAADERESLGLLRMLDCGSDATPEPEGRRGAYGKLVGYGVDEITAHAMVVALAGLDQDAARTYLGAHGLADAAQTDVLASTHCTPPVAYLLLSTDQIDASAWRYLGNWDPRRAYLARHTRFLAAPDALQEMTAKLGFTDSEAPGLYRKAVELRSERAVQRFIAPRAGYVRGRWIGCRQQAGGTSLTCPVDARLNRAGDVLETLFITPGAPGDTRLRIASGANPTQSFEYTPGLVLLAADTLEAVEIPSATRPNLGVLFDPAHERVLIGPPPLLRSMFTQLVFLDGRYWTHFKKDVSIGLHGEHVLTWKIDWGAHPQSQPVAQSSQPRHSAL